jgi:hypothetical protein
LAHRLLPHLWFLFLGLLALGASYVAMNRYLFPTRRGMALQPFLIYSVVTFMSRNEL